MPIQLILISVIIGNKNLNLLPQTISWIYNQYPIWYSCFEVYTDQNSFFSRFFFLKNHFIPFRSVFLKFLLRYYRLSDSKQPLFIIVCIYNIEEHCWAFTFWLPLVATIVASRLLGCRISIFCWGLESRAVFLIITAYMHRCFPYLQLLFFVY